MRPLSARETVEQSADEFHTRWTHTETSLVEDSDLSRKAYTFDAVLGADEGNAAVYERSAKRVVSLALQGYNGSVIAYGQTGSGKTHSMLGTATDPGIVPRALHDIFEYVEAESGELRRCRQTRVGLASMSTALSQSTAFK